MSTVTFDSQTSLTALQEQLRKRLCRMRRAMRGRFIAEAAARVLAAFLVALTLSLWLDWWLELSRLGRGAFAAVALTAVAGVAWRSLIQPLAMSLDPIDVAAAMDRRANDGARQVAAQVASVLQLPEHLDQPPGQFAGDDRSSCPAEFCFAGGRGLQEIRQRRAPSGLSGHCRNVCVSARRLRIGPAANGLTLGPAMACRE